MENIWCIQVWNREMNLVCSSTQLQQRTSDRQPLAFRICQNCLTHQSVLKTLNVCQILAHWQFAAIQNSFLRQSESCWVLSDRNPPGQQGWASVLFCKSFSNLKKAIFTSVWPWHLQGRAHKAPKWGIPRILGVGIQELILGWEIWISQSRNRSQGVPLMPGWDVQGSALGLDLSWAESGVQSCSVKLRFLFQSQILAEPQGRCSEEAHALSPSLNPRTLQSLSTSF